MTLGFVMASTTTSTKKKSISFQLTSIAITAQKSVLNTVCLLYTQYVTIYYIHNRKIDNTNNTTTTSLFIPSHNVYALQADGKHKNITIILNNNVRTHFVILYFVLFYWCLYSILFRTTKACNQKNLFFSGHCATIII